MWQDYVNDEMVQAIITAIVGLLITTLLAIITAATNQLREWLKMKKLTAARTILDDMIANAKKAITPEMIAAGESALAAYLAAYVKRNGPQTVRTLNADDNQLLERMEREAAAVIKAHAPYRRTIPGATPAGGVLYDNAEG